MNGGGGQTMVYGIPVTLWNSWAKGYDGSLGELSPQQQLWLDEYNRTPEQQNYVDTKSDAFNLAYAYTGIIDYFTGWEAVETGEKVNDEIIPYIDDVVSDPLNQSLVLAVLLGGLYLVLKGK